MLRPQRDFVFVQNHRRFVRSRDDLQLHGELKSTVSSDCDPFSKVNGTPIAPCGAIANSLFNGRLFYTCISLLHYNHRYNRADSALQWQPKNTSISQKHKNLFRQLLETVMDTRQVASLSSHYAGIMLNARNSIIRRIRNIHSDVLFLVVFNTDSFTLSWNKDSNTQVPVGLTYENIAWKSDREVKFKNPPGNLKEAFKDFAKPPNWPRPVYELDVNNSDDNGFKNQDFIVWMRTAAFSTFRKLYRKIILTGEFKNGLPKGEYMLDIKYSILLSTELFCGKY